MKPQPKRMPQKRKRQKKGLRVWEDIKLRKLPSEIKENEVEEKKEKKKNIAVKLKKKNA